MTDLSLIKSDFLLLSELTEAQGEKYEPLLEAQAKYVSALLKDSENENDSSVVFLCAARAFYQYLLINQSDGVTSFSAGDVSYSVGSGYGLESAKILCEFALEQCSDKINAGTFAFEAV